MDVRNKPLILVVDDQATIIRIITSLLQPTYDVCVATNGRKALDVAEAQLPDLILLDNMMPEMTGVETCFALKENPRTADIPVIFVTSMDDKHNEQMGFKAGAVDYMNKPPSQELIHARIKIHLKNRRQRMFLNQIATREITGEDKIRQAAMQLLSD